VRFALLTLIMLAMLPARTLQGQPYPFTSNDDLLGQRLEPDMLETPLLVDAEVVDVSLPVPKEASSPATESTATAEEIPPGPVAAARPDAGDGDEETGIDELKLADVVASLYRSYPDIIRARQERIVAGGTLMSAYGAYDTRFQAESLSEPTGFYQTYRNGLGVARQTWWGGYVAAGYRIGRGFYQPWYKERQTDDAGEFKVAVAQPLLRGRAIDPQRVAVFSASLDQQAAVPLVQQMILQTSRDAAFVYWQWVSMGAVLEAQQELLNLAEERGEQFEVGFKAGRFPEIDLILNQQLIAERQGKFIETQQAFREIAFKLSMFLRDPSGQPMVPSDEWLPTQFPRIDPPPASSFADDLAAALSRRPEIQLVQNELRQIELQRSLARNDMLPRLDFVAEASQDMGAPASASIDDKGDFELVIGFQSDVPIQRRNARGRIQSTSAKINQINEKLRITQDKIGVELQAAYNALNLSAEVIAQNELALRAAIDTVDRYRFAFERGNVDLLFLNLLEVKANETEIRLVEAQRDWFAALADMQYALGLDPLEQAITVSSLPPSERPGPGNLPRPTQTPAQPVDNE